FTIKVITFATAWPGATAQEMQDQVAEPLEKRMQELTYYDRAETFTRPGFAFTTLWLKDTIPPKLVPEQIYQARKKPTDEAPKLPRGVAGPFINDEFGDVTFALYALKARGVPPRRLAREAERVRDRLLAVPGVKKVLILGERPERIFVDFSNARLAALGVAPRDVFAALADRNLLTPAGAIETSGPQVQVRLDLAADLPSALADAHQVEMALLNLAVNARDAMPIGGEFVISAQLTEQLKKQADGVKPGRYVVVKVADTGTGMDADTRRRAIEPFFSTKGVGRGTGLGLSMAHGLALQLGG
ncbi:hypothetical protein LTR94_028636, partial [Friedmanniomyces endolithicus]